MLKQLKDHTRGGSVTQGAQEKEKQEKEKLAKDQEIYLVDKLEAFLKLRESEAASEKNSGKEEDRDAGSQPGSPSTGSPSDSESEDEGLLSGVNSDDEEEALFGRPPSPELNPQPLGIPETAFAKLVQQQTGGYTKLD